MENLKALLRKECEFQLSDAILDDFLSVGEEVMLKKNDILIMTGQIDPNIYIVMDGVLRRSYMNGSKEAVFGFGLAGTVIIEMHCYYYHLPSFYQIEACCNTKVLKIPKGHYDHLVKNSHEFAQWALSYEQCHLFCLERRDAVVNGTAKERFISLIRNRPYILESVALKHIASYMGVTLPYLSYLKRNLK